MVETWLAALMRRRPYRCLRCGDRFYDWARTIVK
jgi:hypothetical protein